MYLIIPTQKALEGTEKFDGLFSFYRNGIRGLIADYVALAHREITTDPSCSAGEFRALYEMVRRVIAKYEQTTEYQSQLHSYPNCQMEIVVEAVCGQVLTQVDEILIEHESWFKQEFVFDFNDVFWVGGALTVAVKRNTSVH